jgi:hypothetical protein
VREAAVAHSVVDIQRYEQLSSATAKVRSARYIYWYISMDI